MKDLYRTGVILTGSIELPHSKTNIAEVSERAGLTRFIVHLFGNTDALEVFIDRLIETPLLLQRQCEIDLELLGYLAGS